MTIKAVVFDIGNVLIQWAPEPVYDRLIGLDRRNRLFAEVDLYGMNEQVDLGADLKVEATALAQKHPEWAAEIMIWHDRWLDMLGPAIDDSVRMLRALRRNGVPVFALSNFGKGTFELAQTHFPFLEEFDDLYVSGYLGMQKPDPAIYEALEQGTGIDPKGLLFTDDRPENTAAAEKRGWQTHLFDGPEGFVARLEAENLLS